MLQEATLDCIEHIKKSLLKIVEIKIAKEMALNAPRRKSIMVVEVPKGHPNKRLAQFQDILDEDAKKVEAEAR